MPSNHAYFTRIDSRGYLWIATDRGVVKYNGYTFKVFDRSSGIHTSDVWYLYEDHKGRMWFSSISDEIGYVYRDTYHKLFIRDTDVRIYPSYFRQNISGDITLISQFDKNDIFWKVYWERRDTLYLKKSFGIPVFIGLNKEYYVSDGAIYTEYAADSQIVSKPVCSDYLLKKQNYILGLDSFIICYNKGDNFLTVFNTNNCSHRQLHLLPDDHVIFVFFDKQLIVQTDVSEYIYSAALHEIKHYKLKSLLPADIHAENNVLQVNEDSMWQKIIATANNGIFISYKPSRKFYRLKYDLKEYRCAGNFNDYIFWWNKSARRLDIQKDNKIQTYHCKEFSDVYVIVPYDSGKSILSTNAGFFLLENSSICSGKKLSIKHLGVSGTLPFYKNIFATQKNTFYGIHAIKGIENLTVENDSLLPRNLYSFRFTGAFFDTSRKILWCYAPMKIVICYKDGQIKVLDRTQLQKMGLDNIESILTDSYGNIFIKDADKLVAYDENLANCVELLKEYNLANARVSVVNNRIIAAGKFGVAFSKIYGAGSFSKSVLYPNVKNMLYEYVLDIANLNYGVVLNTDKALYSILWPADSEYERGEEYYHLYRWNISKNKGEKYFNAGDTILLNSKNDFIELDVVNPYGNGALKFDYFIEGERKWINLNANELYLPKLAPGQYYKVSFSAKDDVWRSKPVMLTIYIMPYWWQTKAGAFLLTIAGLLLCCAISVVAVQLTRKHTIRKNAQKNLQLELELKAIHAQINPHFIFNTLNSALSFIRREKYDDAYAHILKFSSLLRAYIKSSRNRLVILNDEIQNLKNYIELQQTRFVNKFDYSIEVGKGIDAMQIFIPSLLLQPIVENAINHGLIPLNTKGFLHINFKLIENDTMLIVVDDNGIGREAARIINGQNDRKESWGGILVNDLVTIFNSYEKIKISIQYIDKHAPLQGTAVEIRIKYPDHVT